MHVCVVRVVASAPPLQKVMGNNQAIEYEDENKLKEMKINLKTT